MKSSKTIFKNFKLAIIFAVLSFSLTSNFYFVDYEKKCESNKIIIRQEEWIDLYKLYKECPELLEEKVKPRREREAMARIVDSYAPNSDEICKIAILELIMTRVETAGFPNNIIDVCEQPNQWSNYNRNKEPSKESYLLADNFLNSFYDNYSNMYIDDSSVFVRKAEEGLYFRDNLFDVSSELFIPYYS